MKRRVWGALVLMVSVFVAACTGNNPAPGEQAAAPVEVIVSAAASLTDALKELQTTFEASNKQVKIRFNFGSSGALGQQIEQGAPADLFISAATGPMDSLVKKNLVDPAAVTTLAANKVVLIGGKTDATAVKTWADMKSDQVKRVAIGNPAHVPAGQYGKAVLEKLGLWADVERKLVLGEDARHVLNYVESGEVQAGIVYSTDAASSQKVQILAEAPAGSHPPVVYPMAVLKGSRNGAQAKAFATYLSSAAAQQVLARYGFSK